MKSDTCLHCWGEMAERGRCGECGDPACTECIERSAECSRSTLPRIVDLVDFLARTDHAVLATLRRLATAHAKEGLRTRCRSAKESAVSGEEGVARDSSPEDAVEATTLKVFKANAQSEARRRLKTLRARLRRLIERLQSRTEYPALSLCLAIGDLLAQEPSEADDFLACRQDHIYGDHMECHDRHRNCEDCEEFPRVEFDRFTWLQERIVQIAEPYLNKLEAEGAEDPGTVDGVLSAEEAAANHALDDMYCVAVEPDTDYYGYLVAEVSEQLRKVGL